MPRPRPTAALAVLLLSSFAACGGSSGGERIVLITLDTLRWDSLVGRDGGPGSMPNLAALAAEGTLFDRYYSATSTTQPTHATLFTGRHPWLHGVPFNGAVLAPEYETLVEHLRAKGYHTAGAIASFPVHSQFGFDQGFDVFLDDFTQGDVQQWSGVDVEADGFYSEAESIVDKAIELLDAAKGSKQFFWFHMYDPHAPYGDSGRGKVHLSPREITGLIKAGEAADAVCARARRAYDRDVSYMDAQLGRLFERLKQDAGFETHVVVLSDHGESFGEGGSLGHGKRLTPEQIHVPLVIDSPRVERGVRSVPVGTVDVTATLLSLGGIENFSTGGRDLTGEIEPGVVLGMRRTYNEPYVEVRTDGARVVIKPENRRFFLVEDGVLYVGGTGGVSIDDSERPLEDAARVAKYQELFESFAQDFNAFGVQALDDTATFEKLRAMGYIGDDDDEH